MYWDAIKQRARVLGVWTAQIVVFLLMLFYLVACGVGGRPLGPKEYVSFIYYCSQWTPDHTPTPPVADLQEK
jgi:hypothetical protein